MDIIINNIINPKDFNKFLLSRGFTITKNLFNVTSDYVSYRIDNNKVIGYNENFKEYEKYGYIINTKLKYNNKLYEICEYTKFIRKFKLQKLL